MVTRTYAHAHACSAARTHIQFSRTCTQVHRPVLSRTHARSHVGSVVRSVLHMSVRSYIRTFTCPFGRAHFRSYRNKVALMLLISVRPKSCTSKRAYVRAYVHLCACVCACARACKCACECACVRASVLACARVHVRACVCSFV